MIGLDIYKGSAFQGVFTFTADNDQNVDVPIDLTGWTVDIYDASPSIANAEVTITDAVAGEVSIFAPWNDQWAVGSAVRFRLRLAHPTDAQITASTPLYTVVVR